MEQIVFDINKLAKTDKALYEQMTDFEKANYERTWISIETAKVKLSQHKNTARVRINRSKREIADKERRERTHMLCQIGGHVLSLIDDYEDFEVEMVLKILNKALSSDYIKRYIEKIREKNRTKNQNTEKNTD